MYRGNMKECSVLIFHRYFELCCVLVFKEMSANFKEKVYVHFTKKIMYIMYFNICIICTTCIDLNLHSGKLTC